MLASQSDIAKHSCLYSQEAVALQMPGVFFDSPGTCNEGVLGSQQNSLSQKAIFPWISKHRNIGK